MKAQRSDKLLRQWSFSRDGQNWQTVRIPHDWAISGPFDKKWDLQQVAIKENGETKATEKSGRSGALPWIGDGEYKTSLTVPLPLPDGPEITTMMPSFRFSSAMPHRSFP